MATVYVIDMMHWQHYLPSTWWISNITFHLHDALATISVFGSIHEQHFLFEHGAKTTIYVVDMMHLFSNIICHLHDELATHITFFLASFMNNISVLATLLSLTWCIRNIICNWYDEFATLPVINMMNKHHYHKQLS